MASSLKNYAQVMMEAAEHVYVFALRRGMDSGVVSVSFDTGRGDEPQYAHRLTIAVRNSGISVTKENIPHGCFRRYRLYRCPVLKVRVRAFAGT
jgi:hypothetical protein